MRAKKLKKRLYGNNLLSLKVKLLWLLSRKHVVTRGRPTMSERTDKSALQLCCCTSWASGRVASFRARPAHASCRGFLLSTLMQEPVHIAGTSECSRKHSSSKLPSPVTKLKLQLWMRYRVSNAYQIFKSKFNHVQLVFSIPHFHLWLCSLVFTYGKSANPLLCPVWGSVFPPWYGIVFFFPSAQTGQEQVHLHIRDFRQCFELQNCSILLKKWCQLCASVSNKDACPTLPPQCCLSCSKDEFSAWDMYQPTRTGYWLKAVWDACPMLVMGWAHCLGYRQQPSLLWKHLSVFHHSSFFMRLASAETYTRECE